MMIVTLTANPSVDRTLFIPELPHGGITRSDRSDCEPSGKGVNVALALAQHGHATRAVFPEGGFAGVQLRAMLQDAGVDHVAVPIKGGVRTNISLVEPSGTVTKVNEAGPVLTDKESAELMLAACSELSGATWMAGCGSLPAGVSEHLYGRLIDECRDRGVKVAIDAWGAPLRHALAHGPDLISPNVAELASVVERSIENLGDVLDAAELLRQQGARAVLASLGPDGALLVDDDGACHGEAPVDEVASAVGAGDALLAGFLAAGGKGRTALATALAWAAAAVQNGGTLFTAANSAPVLIHEEVNSERLLHDPVRKSSTALNP